MDHGTIVDVLAVIAGSAVLWGLVSSRFERWGVTGPIAFLVLGLVAANPPLSLITVHASNSAVRGVAELTLAIVLFADASRVHVRALRHDAAIPVRLLGIGLPLTVGLGCLVALVVFTGIDPWVAAVIAAVVAPTDAALSAPILEDRRIPGRVRRILNVESGLNDGIATPIVTFAIAGAAGVVHPLGSGGLAHALVDLALGVLIGAGTGFAGGVLLRHAPARVGWASHAFRPIAVLGLALLAYALTLEAGGNAFVAAFVGGMAFASGSLDELSDVLELTTDAGALGSVVVWFLFGGLLVNALEHSSWGAIVYAVLSLTVVRMVPVAISLVGTGLDRATVGVIGWFGPRGLASIVFVLIANDALDAPDAHKVLGAVAVVILLSAVAHGVSARPISGWYGGRVAALSRDVPEHVPKDDLPSRPFVRQRRVTG